MNASIYLGCILICVFIVLIVRWYLKRAHFKKYLKNIPELKGIPLLGGAHHFPTLSALHYKLLEFRKSKGPIFWLMLVDEPVAIISDAGFIESLLSSNKQITKSKLYNFYHKWLGTGLLTSTGDKWRRNRKILTPAFHFKILEGFVEIFDRVSDILIEKLSPEVDNESTNVFPHVTLCALDSICESSMGCRVNAQTEFNSNFVRSVKEMCRLTMERMLNLLQNNDYTYVLTNNYKREKEALNVLHSYTRRVIANRRKKFENDLKSRNYELDEFGGKKRMAFLDLMLKYSLNDDGFTDENIREEVDTIMFEGHDTTAAAITFTLYLLSENPICQAKAFKEIQSIFADDRHRSASSSDLQEMKYLELVIKESLRLLPSVPMFARELTEDFEYNGTIYPKGLTTIIVPYVIHKDERHFEDPEKFIPERFLSENAKNRHPFCYIPFSAGPRNCIGQKFAMMSMKSTLSKIIRNFEIVSVGHKLNLSNETVLKSTNGVFAKLKLRKW